MASPADEIPSLEQLMRNVVRLAMQVQKGSDWLEQLSGSIARTMEKDAALASRNRPKEVLRDDWEAAGLETIGSLLRSDWPAAMSPMWTDATVATVDLDRLLAYRGKNLHKVGAPVGEITDEEAAALMKRLRLGFEAARRELLDESGEWWPYVAAIHSKVPQFCWERSEGARYLNSVLNEGDLVTIDVTGVHPGADDSRLRFRLRSSEVTADPPSWAAATHFELAVPHVRRVHFSAQVGDVEYLDSDFIDRAHLSIDVRPKAPLGFRSESQQGDGEGVHR